MSQPAHDPTEPAVVFGTLTGVFRPTVLTILGAMLYLRLGWLVGNNGLLGALAVIAMAYAITGTTALSMSSIATNTRVRPGGAFGIVAGALGLEAGGAIGIPLYVAQTASSAMYLYAFSEGWDYLVGGGSDPRLVVAAAFMAVCALAWQSATLAFRAQAVMLVVIAAAISSAALGTASAPLTAPTALGSFSHASPLHSFAIFFPAATGILVGVGMSGNLDDPRTSIPRGTLYAWAFTLTIYVLGAVWYSVVATPSELLVEKTIMVDRALVGVVVLIGLLASTLMAALSTLVAAPRLLAAMADEGVVPYAGWLRERSGGEPRRAIAVTMGIAAMALLSGSLDAIAPIITSIFIGCYLAINAVVALEQALQMISFRPTFAVPAAVPMAGVGFCAFALVGTSPGGGLLEVLIVGLIYAWLHGRKLDTPWETARSGIGISIAAYTARQWGQEKRSERAWKPDLLVVVQQPKTARRLLPLVTGIAHLNGSVKLVGIGEDPDLEGVVDHLRAHLLARDVYTTRALIGEDDWRRGTVVAIDALQGALFPPNLILIDAAGRTEDEIRSVIDRCILLRLGVLIYVSGGQDLDASSLREVNVWVSTRTNQDVTLKLHQANLDLPVLTGWLLTRFSHGHLRLVSAVSEDNDPVVARDFLEQVVEHGRLPAATSALILRGDFQLALRRAQRADLQILGMSPNTSLETLLQQQALLGSPCLFALDSGYESLLA